MRIELLIPDLLLAPPAGGALDIYQGLALPALELLLARAQRSTAPDASMEHWLLRRFGVPTTRLPAAQLGWRADGGAADDAIRLRADPVHLQAQRDQLVLVEAGQLAITLAEAQALVASLNEHFAADGLTFVAPHPQRWYVTLPAPCDLECVPLPQVAGRPVNGRLPRGEDAPRFQRYLTELQMLLHTHPANQAREAQGSPAINSVWWWGEGRLTEPPSAPGLTLWADDAFARGLALAAGSTSRPLPDAANALLGTSSPGDHLVVWDGLRAAAWYGDYTAWRAALARLERDWAVPLARAWRRSELGGLQVVATNALGTQSFTLGTGQRWALWRRPQPLARYAVRDRP